MRAGALDRETLLEARRIRQRSSVAARGSVSRASLISVGSTAAETRPSIVKAGEGGSRERNWGTATAGRRRRACLARNPAAAYRDPCDPLEERSRHAASAGYQTRLPGYSGHTRAVGGTVDSAISDVRRESAVGRPRDRHLGILASLEKGLHGTAAQASRRGARLCDF